VLETISGNYEFPFGQLFSISHNAQQMFATKMLSRAEVFERSLSGNDHFLAGRKCVLGDLEDLSGGFSGSGNVINGVVEPEFCRLLFTILEGKCKVQEISQLDFLRKQQFCYTAFAPGLESIDAERFLIASPL